ncbi:MAG: hypothetical protein K6T83_03205 [Alicyclobacillus sp.]|nr:hypothetical protein [Alicyclobacillus sp.]
MELYIEAWFEFNDIITGRKKPGPSSAFLEEARRRIQEYQNKTKAEQTVVTGKELGWDKDDA